MLARRAIPWQSARQALIASSTTVEEYITCYEASNIGNWLKKLCHNSKVVQEVERPLKIYCDNQSAVMFANSNRSLIKSKHIYIKYLVVKERVQNRQLSIEHIGSNSMLTDPLTKAVSASVFVKILYVWVSLHMTICNFSGSLMYFICLFYNGHVV